MQHALIPISVDFACLTRDAKGRITFSEVPSKELDALVAEVKKEIEKEQDK
jgi:hypothetical protein